MIKIQIRYNTNCTDNINYWRILINGVEYICSDIEILIPVSTTRDNVFDPQRNTMVDKHHISCMANEVIWNGTKVKIT